MREKTAGVGIPDTRTSRGTWDFYLIPALYLFGIVTPALQQVWWACLEVPWRWVCWTAATSMPCAALPSTGFGLLALSLLPLPGLAGCVHLALQCGWPVFRNRHPGVSFYGTVPTWQLSHHWEQPVCKRAVSQFCVIVHRIYKRAKWALGAGTLWYRAGAGRNWKHRCVQISFTMEASSWCAVAACPPPLPGSLCGQMWS